VLKELELEARKVAALEQQMKLQEVGIQVMAQHAAHRGGGNGRVNTVMEASAGEESAGMVEG
jgi:hypothetical protein